MNRMKIVSILAGVALLSAACQGATPSLAPTTNPAVVLTAAAQTAAVRLTQLVALTPSASPTSTTPTPDLAQTAAVATVAAQLTGTASAATHTPTPTMTPTSLAVGAFERAEFVTDVTVKDGAVFAPGASFKKTWRIKNAGTTTWNSQYALVFVQGDRMGAPDLVHLTTTVAPGATIDISVDLVAPTPSKSYRGYWRMINAAGKFFDDSVYVDIVVSSTTVTPSPTGASGTGTPTLTPTTAGFTISNATMIVDTQTYSGTCPHTLTFTARFTASQPGQVTYSLKADSSTPGFTFNLPAATTMSAIAGENVLQFYLEMQSTVTGWVALNITAPVNLTSTQANFTLICKP